MVEIYFNDCAESARKGIIMNELTLAGIGIVMPSKYVEIDREEMTYIEGGYQGFWNSVSTIGIGLDCIAIAAGVGTAIKTGSALRALLKSNAGKTLTRSLRNEILRLFGSKAAGLFVAAVDLAFTISGRSLGAMIAMGIDMIDTNRGSGYLFD
jgi:hypothetical protein